MNLVTIDTSTRWAGVGLQTATGEQTHMVWKSDQNHGRELMPAIVELATRAGLTTRDITHLAVALGPGGFSAVRVGISTVTGLAMPAGIPVVGIPTHEIEVYPFRDQATPAQPVISLIPAGRSELSWQRFESETGAPVESGLSSVDVILENLHPQARICGEGAETLAGKVDDARILTPESPTRSPLAMLEIASRRFADGKQTQLTELRPIYARPPSITTRKNPA